MAGKVFDAILAKNGKRGNDFGQLLLSESESVAKKMFVNGAGLTFGTFQKMNIGDLIPGQYETNPDGSPKIDPKTGNPTLRTRGKLLQCTLLGTNQAKLAATGIEKSVSTDFNTTATKDNTAAIKDLTAANRAQSFRGWHPVAVNGAFGNIAGLVLRPRHEHLVRQVQRRSHHDVQQRNHKRPQQACRHFSGRIYPQLIQVHIRGLQQEPFVIGAEHPREPEERRYEVRVLQPHTREVALPSCLTQLALRKSKPPSTDLFCTAISLSEVFAPVPPLARLCRFTCRSAQLGR